MSQRDKDFNGGVKPGTTAFDEDSRRLDKYLKEMRDSIIAPEFKMVKKFDKDMKNRLVGKDCFGFEPDGGAWFKNGKLVAVFEAKKQGKLGNANERWFKNASIAYFINSDVKYVTFCTGEGADKGNPLDKMGDLAECIFGKNNIFHCQVEPFTKRQVCDIMIEVLEGI